MKTSVKKAVKKLKPVSKSIVRQKVWVDTKIVSPKCCHLKNRAEFTTFKSDADPSIIPESFAKDNKPKMNNWVCFSGLPSMIAKGNINRLYDRLEVMTPGSAGPGGQFILTPEERVAWLLLAKQYRLLPPYINENAITDIPKDDIKKKKSASYGIADAAGEFIIDLEGLSPAVLYIYLSTIRNIREDPGLARAVPYLVNDLGMNFYAAYAFASKIVISTTGHHILTSHRDYGVRCDKFGQSQLEAAGKVSLNIPIGLQRIVNNDPLRYDKRDIVNYDPKKDTYIGGFNCSSTIEKISKVTYIASLQELFDKDIIDAIMSKSDREANKSIAKFLDKKDHIKYKEAKK